MTDIRPSDSISRTTAPVPPVTRTPEPDFPRTDRTSREGCPFFLPPSALTTHRDGDTASTKPGDDDVELP